MYECFTCYVLFHRAQRPILPPASTHHIARTAPPIAFVSTIVSQDVVKVGGGEVSYNHRLLCTCSYDDALPLPVFPVMENKMMYILYKTQNNN